jgi:hypothetical protein
MKRLAIAVVFACAAAAAIAVPRGAAAAETHFNCATFDNQGNVISVTPNCSQTISMQGGPPQSMPSFDPCTGNPGTLTINTTHQIFHINVNGAGDLWTTGTVNGTMSFVPDDTSAPSGSGAWATWFGGSDNNRNGVFHSTFNAQIHFPGGVTATLHEVFHVTLSGTGTITTSFDKGSALTGGTCN